MRYFFEKTANREIQSKILRRCHFISIRLAIIIKWMRIRNDATSWKTTWQSEWLYSWLSRSPHASFPLSSSHSSLGFVYEDVECSSSVEWGTGGKIHIYNEREVMQTLAEVHHRTPHSSQKQKVRYTQQCRWIYQIQCFVGGNVRSKIKYIMMSVSIFQESRT